MKQHFKPNGLHFFFAFIWIANGLICKVLDYVPRHREIVASVLQTQHSAILTFFIGLSEIAMGVWILTGVKKRLNVLVQIALVAAMNMIEFILVPDLLLWGRLNAVFALCLIGLIYYNEFYAAKKPSHQLRCFLF